MKTTFVFCSLVFAMTLGLHAQTFISFSAGPNFPGGDLASQNTDSLGSGFAKTGIALDLSVGKLLYKKLGLISTLRYQRNNLDKKPLQRYGTVTSDPWQSLNVSLGPYLELKLWPKLFIDFNVQCGYYKTFERTLNVSGPNTIVNIDQKAAGAFSTLYGLNLRYELIDHLSVGINMDYFTSIQSFKAKYDLQHRLSGTESSRDREYKMDMQSINAKISVSYKFTH